MRILGDVNLVTAATSGTIAVVLSFIVARAVAVRQARAKTREDARRTIMELIATHVGTVRLTIQSSLGQQRHHPHPRVGELGDDGDVSGLVFLRELARASDDLGVIRRWRTRRAAERAFGRDRYGLARLGRWNSTKEMAGAAMRAMVAGVSVRPDRPGLWQVCETEPTARRLRLLDGALCRVWSAGGLLAPSPVAVPRWRRPIDRIAAALQLPEPPPRPRPRPAVDDPEPDSASSP